MTAWTRAEDDVLREALANRTPYSALAESMGRSVPAIRNRVYTLRIGRDRTWSDLEIEILKGAYTRVPLNIRGIAAELGRTVASVELKASRMGLGDATRPKKMEEDKVKRRKYATVEESRAAVGEATRRRIAEKGHPLGALGMKHSKETLRKISEASIASWQSKSKEQQEAITAKAIATSRANGTWGARKETRGSWKAGWREIGGKRKFYRSRWEANYARYLEWLKQNGQIKEWAHEPEVFWFEAIRRGVRSYKPDFRVWEMDGSSALHEVKGWMDSRSRTCLSRMAKYHPGEKIVLIDGPQYRAIRLKVMRMIAGWEDAERDSRA